MRVDRLACSGFRNLAQVTLDLSPAHTIVLRGENGQGKTNLLEALYVCATGKSFRHATPGELLAWGSSSGQVSALFRRQGVHHRVEVTLTPHRRAVRVDDRHLPQASRLLQLINVVAFFPDDLRLVKGGPEERRRFLDRAIANLQPTFVEAAAAYHRVLRSRNALLRQEGRLDDALVATYDEQLIEHAEVVQQRRRAGLALLSPVATELFAQVMPEVSPLGLQLTSGLPEQLTEDYRGAMARALRHALPRDRRQGSTSVGPHRVDLGLSFAGRPAREFASQGQQRVMVLALKLAEVLVLRRELHVAPILLLDDVSSELDTRRAGRLFETLLTLGSQVWLSTTGAAPLPLPADVQIIRVIAGTAS